MASARLFVALELPGDVRAALAAWAGEAVGAAQAAGAGVRVRALATESLHVTLCFLGSVDEEEIRPIGLAMDGAVAAQDAVITLQVSDALWLPPRRPRVCAVGLTDVDGTLGPLQARVAGALEAGGWYAPEGRPFLAHVTVARLGRDGPRRAPALAVPALPRFAAPAVTLFRSRPGAGGSRYEPLARRELPAQTGAR